MAAAVAWEAMVSPEADRWVNMLCPSFWGQSDGSTWCHCGEGDCGVEVTSAAQTPKNTQLEVSFLDCLFTAVHTCYPEGSPETRDLCRACDSK